MIELPVIGVFYSESELIHGWLENVFSQQASSVIPIPILAVNQCADEQKTRQILAGLDEFWSRYPNKRIELIRLDGNDGHTIAFNRAVERTRSKFPSATWIASLDPDARFGPGTLAKLMTKGCTANDIGMVTPIVIQSNCRYEPDRWRQSEIGESQVLHVGHCPFVSPDSNAKGNFWKSPFAGKRVRTAIEILEKNPTFGPFTACFCAGLWSVSMLENIDPPDEKQFRTLNCGEIGYRGQLFGYRTVIAIDALAFHPQACTHDFQLDEIDFDRKNGAYHQFHAQGLISLKYFPDELRLGSIRYNSEIKQWTDLFPDLVGIEPLVDQASRLAAYERWSMFIAPRRFGR